MATLVLEATEAVVIPGQPRGVFVVQGSTVVVTARTPNLHPASLVVRSGRGPQGPVGPVGPPGADGADGAVGPTGATGPAGQDGLDGQDGQDGLSGGSYMHTQMMPSSDWVIVHNLGFVPSVTVADTQGGIGSGDMEIVSANEIIMHFAFDFAGTAYLS